MFFATLDLHLRDGRRRRLVRFGPIDVPILAPEHLIACKAIFDRPEAELDARRSSLGPEVDVTRTLYWVGEILGPEAEAVARLAELLSTGAVASPSGPFGDGLPTRPIGNPLARP